MRMTDPERKTLWAKAMKFVSRHREHVPLTKHEFRACVDSVDNYVEANEAAIATAVANNTLDAYIESNLAAINASFPQPARALLTRPQKEFVFKAVVRREVDDGT